MQRFFSNMKIGKKLILSYLLACLIPLLLTSLLVYKVAADNLEESSMEFASVFSSQIITNLDDFIEEYDKVTKSVLVDNDILYQLDTSGEKSILEQVDNQIEVRKIMMRLTTLKPEIEGIIFLTKNDGLYQFNTDGDNVDIVELKKQTWLEQIMHAEDQLVITSIHNRSYYDRNADGITMTVGRRIYNNAGAYEGILLIDLEPSSLLALSDSFLLARSNYNIKISITDAHDDILYDSDVASGRITWKEARAAENPYLFHKDQDDYLIMTSETKRGALKVNVVIPRSDLLFKINRIGHVTALALFVCSSIVIVISSLLSGAITRPIRNLQKQMAKVEQGNYEIMSQKPSEDEIGSLVSSYNHMVTRIKTLIEDVYIGEIKRKNAQFLALQTQINPHMLYNTLDSIRMKALMNGDDEVADMIKILARMFRRVLGKDSSETTIKDEIDYTVNYVRLQNMRSNNMFSFDVDLEETILNASVISMVFQPVIENSIEHGYKGYGTPLHITMKGAITPEQDILLQISDDGRGMSEEQVERINRMISMTDSEWLSVGAEQEEGKTSIGLKNIAERIRLHYGSDYYLKIRTSTELGTVIDILMPGQWIV